MLVDFVARNIEFQSFAQEIVSAVNSLDFHGDIDVNQLINLEYQHQKVQDRLVDAIAKIKENIVIRRAMNLSIPAHVGFYVHGKVGLLFDLLMQHLHV